MKSLPRGILDEAKRLQPDDFWIDWSRRHPQIVLSFDGRIIKQSFSSTSAGNGRALQNMITALRRKVRSVLADVQSTPS